MRAKPNNAVDEQLREEVLACQEISHFEGLIAKYPRRINEIAAILDQEYHHCHSYFIRAPDPAFAALMRKFPLDFRRRIKASIAKIIERVFTCSTMWEFERLVWMHRAHIPTIAAVLLDEKEHFQQIFICSDDPSFFEMLKLFPPNFLEAVNKEIQRQHGAKPHAFTFDDDLTKIIQDNAITIHNPHKDCTLEQDPVFLNLTAKSASAEPSHYIRTALDKIKNDPRFLSAPKSDRLNAAGIAITAYTKKRLAQEQLLHCKNTSDLTYLIKDFKDYIPELAAAILQDKF